MTLDEFQDLLDTHGGDPEKWPPVFRDKAILLLQDSEEAQTLHEEALAMDLLLQGEAPPAPSTTAMTSLFEDVARHAEAEANREEETFVQPSQPEAVKIGLGERLLDFIFRPAYALGASAALGVVFGVWDIWLEPTSQTSALTEFVFSALPL